MKILVLAGLGPTMKHTNTLAGTFFDEASGTPLHTGLGRVVDPTAFVYSGAQRTYPVLRPQRGAVPVLTAVTLGAILEGCGREYESFRLEDVWMEACEPALGTADVVALSTTYICNWMTLRRAIVWIRARYPRAHLILGGQYTNMKHLQVMREMATVDFIVRGDGEVAFPMLLDALEGNADLGKVPNLVRRGATRQSVLYNDFEYIDLERYPSPRFSGLMTTVPYESMRGCPFSCKFCSYPFASPQWRYKSADKICRDWEDYAAQNSATFIKSMDSTFTVPNDRFRELLEKLPAVGVAWKSYSRANVIQSAEIVSALEAAHCRSLSIGFESMSEASLKRMNKQVRVEHNERANDLLARSEVELRGTFIIGYPGETAEEAAMTARFLREQFVGHFLVSVFSLIDETMPVWQDAARFQLRVVDTQDPESEWEHAGLDSKTANTIRDEIIREVRWKNDRCVGGTPWSMYYQSPFVSELSLRENRRVEKLIDRLAFAPIDHAAEPDRVRAVSAELLDELALLGVRLAAPSATA